MRVCEYPEKKPQVPLVRSDGMTILLCPQKLERETLAPATELSSRRWTCGPPKKMKMARTNIECGAQVLTHPLRVTYSSQQRALTQPLRVLAPLLS